MGDVNQEENPNVDLRPGVVTSIKRQVKHPDRVSLFIDGEFAIGLSASVVLSVGLKKGDELTLPDLERIVAEEQYARARSKALNFLSFRPRTVHEIRERLVKYGYETVVIDSVVEWLAERRYLDDTTFAQQFVEERTMRKGYGPRRIAADLSRKGIHRDVIESVLFGAETPTTEIAPVVMRKAAQRWARLGSEQDPRKKKSKLVQYLQRRGFAYGVAIEIHEHLVKLDEDRVDDL